MSDESCFLECKCLSDAHTIKFQLDYDDHYVDLYTSIFMDQYRGFFGRMWIAIKYLFGYKCKDGHWDCVMLKVDDTDRLISMLYRYKKLHRERCGS